MRLNKEVKVDAAIFPAAVSSNGSTSQYFAMRDYSKALFVWEVILHSAGLTTTSTGTVYQAKDGSANTSAAGLASSTAILTASAKMMKLEVTPAVGSITEGDAFTLTEYDQFGTAQTAKVYTLTANGTADVTISGGITMSLATAGTTGSVSTLCTYTASTINALVGRLYVSATTTAFTVRALNGGESVFLFTASDTTCFTITNAYVQGMIEVDASKMTSSSNFTHLAINVVNESAYYTSAVCIRGGTKRKSKSQQASVLTDLS
jgi:hypothetical protein